MKWRYGVLVSLGAALGCGDNTQADTTDVDAAVPDVMVDAFVYEPCWEPVDPVTQGEATLGTGYDQFEPMPAELPIEFGSQNGFNLVANVQMRGLAPGNPADIFDRSNPRTRIRAFFEDSGIPLNAGSTCPFRVGYKPSSGDTYEMGTGVAVIFETCWRAEHLIGHQVRIKLELLDNTNSYVANDTVVTLAAPVNGMYPTNEGKPGCLGLGDGTPILETETRKAWISAFAPAHLAPRR